MSLIERENPREIKFTPGINPYAAGSTLVEFGNTKVQVTASIEDSVPPFMRGQERGWVTAEYSMLPKSVSRRVTDKLSNFFHDWWNMVQRKKCCEPGTLEGQCQKHKNPKNQTVMPKTSARSKRSENWPGN